MKHFIGTINFKNGNNTTIYNSNNAIFLLYLLLFFNFVSPLILKLV